MSVEANAKLIYAIIETGENADLFNFLIDQEFEDSEKGIQNVDFESIHLESQDKYFIKFEYDHVADKNMIITFGCEISSGRSMSKMMKVSSINAENIKVYDEKISNILRDLHVPEYEKYKPQWYLIAYKD